MKGWYKESHRHYLAAKGIKTNRYMKNKYFMRPILMSDEDKGVLKVKRGTIYSSQGSDRYPDETRLKDINIKENMSEGKLASIKAKVRDKSRKEAWDSSTREWDDSGKIHLKLISTPKDSSQRTAESLKQFMHYQDRKLQPVGFNKEESQVYFDSVEDVVNRIRYGVREEIVPDSGGYRAIWSNNSEDWTVGKKFSPGEKVKLDANEIIVATDFEDTAKKVVDVLPNLPLFGVSHEARVRKKDNFSSILKEQGPVAAKNAELAFWRGRVRSGFASLDDYTEVSEKIKKKYGGL